MINMGSFVRAIDIALGGLKQNIIGFDEFCNKFMNSADVYFPFSDFVSRQNYRSCGIDIHI